MKPFIIISIGIIAVAVVASFNFKSSKKLFISTSKPASHQLWNDVLKKYVTEEGKVNYKGLKNDRKQFDDYLKLLSSSHPNNTWQINEQLAYWINAYNAFTVELILKYYPVKSIRDIGGIVKIPGLQSAWDIKFIKIENQEYSLGYIEHEILRKYNEPRIHFAINCASYSCPKLRNEAFAAENMDEQLNKSAKVFVNDHAKNKITQSKGEISKIFDWYNSDFTASETLVSFINKYSDIKMYKDVKVSFVEYNWNLNE